jgi:ribosomal protein L37E
MTSATVNLDDRETRRHRPHTMRVAGEHIASPAVVAGRMTCPRCGTGLSYDGEELVCITCGYEHDLTPDLRRLSAPSRKRHSKTTNAGSQA